MDMHNIDYWHIHSSKSK